MNGGHVYQLEIGHKQCNWRLGDVKILRRKVQIYFAFERTTTEYVLVRRVFYCHCLLVCPGVKLFILVIFCCNVRVKWTFEK